MKSQGNYYRFPEILNCVNINLVGSSSSSTNINCDVNKCSPSCCCYACCRQSILNDHTYGILKKACNKIFKDFNRQKCREKYAVFPGPNMFEEPPKGNYNTRKNTILNGD